jgi:hypothetical protein
MTKDQRELIAEHGPYTLSEDGILLDRDGISLAFSMRPNTASEECDWDRAVVAALNEVVAADDEAKKFEEGVQFERARTVSWLRGDFKYNGSAQGFADGIERGAQEHPKGPPQIDVGPARKPE